MHTITIFNHKGGVGKTTLTVNIAAALAKKGKKVLLVDSDPQCNLTSYLLADGVVDDLLDNSDEPDGQTIWTAVKPVYDGVGTVRPVDPVECGIKNLFLVPGDIRLSEFEIFLGDAWTDSFKRRLGALRATSSISLLVKSIGELHDIDYVFYDTGPNIGPLNRVLLLDSNHFIVPVACDLFSVRALSTLGQTLRSWIIDWRTISSLAPDDAYLLTGMPRFLGYIPQRYKVYGQKMANAPSKYLRSIERRIFSDIMNVLRSVDSSLSSENASNAKLGQVKDFGVLIQEAQRQGVPLADVVGQNEAQKYTAWKAFREIGDKIIEKTSPSKLSRRKKISKKR